MEVKSSGTKSEFSKLDDFRNIQQNHAKSGMIELNELNDQRIINQTM